LLDGFSQFGSIGLAGFDVHPVRRQIESQGGGRVLGLHRLGDRADTVAAGHVIHLEGDHQMFLSRLGLCTEL